MENKNKSALIVSGVIAAIMLITFVVAIVGKSSGIKKEKSLDDMIDKITVSEAAPKKGQVNLNSNSLYDELPEITKYPLCVEGNGEVDIEIFTSGEKAGSGTDSWLVECATKFNDSNKKTKDGKTVSISLRSVSSGLASDYIASGKYAPDLYTPSNTLFGDYCMVRGGDLTLYNERLVGNTAGILMKKNSEYKDVQSVIKAVGEQKINLGYTNPQTSATGLNLLIQILKDNGGVTDSGAADYFSKFNNNIPFVAYTTQQMRDSASSGTLDGMVTEYQAYINDSNLTSMYQFIPFGMRHDNPLYIVNESSKSADELEAVALINDFLLGNEAQKIATEDGFNANDDYKGSYTTSGAEVSVALDVYKSNKDSGRDIIAVFVADCSGSMDGEPMLQLKQSLSNGASYINDNNYIGLVSYSNDVTIELKPEKFNLTQRSYFQGAIDNLMANGQTASYDAVLVAAKMIEDMKKDHEDAKCMIILLSDGYANVGYKLDAVTDIIEKTGIPIYTISYGEDSDAGALSAISGINEGASINADSEDIVYKIKSLFNSQL